MERESNPMPMCRSGCGFYGNPAQEGLCSVCFKDAIKKKQLPPTNNSVSSSASSNNVASVTQQQQAQMIDFASSVTVPTTTNTAQPTIQSLQHINDIDIQEKIGNDDSAQSGPSTNNDDDDKDDKESKKKKNRCAICRKKVGLTGFECRCGGLFCSMHRYSDKHDCTFDYREHGAQEIRRNNPVVVGEKIQKI